MALGVLEDSYLQDIHSAGDFAEPNAGSVRGKDLLPSFGSDLSAHMLSRNLYQTSGRLYNSKSAFVRALRAWPAAAIQPISVDMSYGSFRELPEQKA